MNAVFGVFDSDLPLRDRAGAAAFDVLSARKDLSVSRHDVGGGVLLTCTSSVAPVHVAATPLTSAFVMGEFAGIRSPAEELCQLAEDDGPSAASGHNGVYLACLASRDGTVSLATDTLGLFPLYFHADARRLVFASEPNLVFSHPAVARRISQHGLAGILLQGHMANGQTLWQGIRRPDVGHIVTWQPGTGVTVSSAHALTPSDEYFGMAYAEARARMAAALASAVHGALPDGPVSLMLSGGLDSRLVAGYLGRVAPGRTTTYTFGDPADIEYRCARAASRALGMTSVRVPMRFERYAELARQCAIQEDAGNSLWDFGWLSGAAEVDFSSSQLISGFHGDPIMGGSSIPWAFNQRSGQYDFESLFTAVNAWGFPPGVTAELMSCESAASVVQDVIDEMRARFDSLPGLPFQKGWLWGLQNRNRLHVFPYAWRLGSRAWPRTPYVDRELLKLAAGMPLCHIRERRIQLDTLKLEFPRLAQVDLDRNSLDCTPVLPTLRSRARQQARSLLTRIRPGTPERRVYHRVFDFNCAGWRSIRESVEPQRRKPSDALRADAVQRALPPADATVTVTSSIRDTAGTKTLCALLMVLETTGQQ